MENKKKKNVQPDYSREPENYDEWRAMAGVKDTKLEREFYDTPPEKVNDFIKKHKKWWNNR